MPALTLAQETTLVAHIRASTNPIVVAARDPNTRDDVTLTNEYNKPSSTDAWIARANMKTIWDATPLTSFDSITIAARRDLWITMIQVAQYYPIDFGPNAARKAIDDIWGEVTASIRQGIFLALVEKATVFEMVFPAPVRTSGTGGTAVSAVNRSMVGQIQLGQMSDALNRNP